MAPIEMLMPFASRGISPSRSTEWFSPEMDLRSIMDWSFNRFSILEKIYWKLPWTTLNRLQMIVGRAQWRVGPSEMTRFGISRSSVDSFSNSNLACDLNYDCIAGIVSICLNWLRRGGNETMKVSAIGIPFDLPVCRIRIVWSGQRKHRLIVISILQCLTIVWIVDGVKCLQEFLCDVDAGRIREEWCLCCWYFGVFRFNVETYLWR